MSENSESFQNRHENFVVVRDCVFWQKPQSKKSQVSDSDGKFETKNKS